MGLITIRWKAYIRNDLSVSEYGGLIHQGVHLSGLIFGGGDLYSEVYGISLIIIKINRCKCIFTASCNFKIFWPTSDPLKSV
jgi:hypothetical protein